MLDNIFAYTAPGSEFPEFLAINRSADKRFVIVTIRGPKRRRQPAPDSSGFTEGDTVDMALPINELLRLSEALLNQR